MLHADNDVIRMLYGSSSVSPYDVISINNKTNNAIIGRVIWRVAKKKLQINEQDSPEKCAHNLTDK